MSNTLPASTPELSTAAIEDGLRNLMHPDRVLTRPIDRVAFASDASVYRLIPKAVVFPRDVGEVQAIFRPFHSLRPRRRRGKNRSSTVLP